LDSRIRSMSIPHNGHYKNQWDNFFHNNIFNGCILRFGSCVGHQVLFNVHKLNLILKHHMGTSMEPHVIGEGPHDKGCTFWKWINTHQHDVELLKKGKIEMCTFNIKINFMWNIPICTWP
jgi:hypothetical protein